MIGCDTAKGAAAKNQNPRPGELSLAFFANPGKNSLTGVTIIHHMNQILRSHC
jgi:hypothetical protein